MLIGWLLAWESQGMLLAWLASLPIIAAYLGCCTMLLLPAYCVVVSLASTWWCFCLLMLLSWS